MHAGLGHSIIIYKFTFGRQYLVHTWNGVVRKRDKMTKTTTKVTTGREITDLNARDQ